MLEPKVIFEDKNFLAIDKPAGLLVHGTASFKGQMAGSERTLVDWLLEKYPEIKDVGDDPKVRPGIVHRLDRETSGVMLVARNQGYFEYLKSLFQKHEIQKTYLALVYGKPKEARGTIDKPLSLKSGTTKRTVHSGKMTKNAVTEYKVLKIGEGSSLLEVYPRTGRTHQIRVHLASIGCPVVGDALYGKTRTAKHKVQRGRNNPQSAISVKPRLMLHALALEFAAAEGKRIRIEAQQPPDMAAD